MILDRQNTQELGVVIYECFHKGINFSDLDFINGICCISC